ncbi:MAG: hypothetical protein LUG60_10590 [Erysipelotrichaceae bacterium]|nr:hypothetical protein [Erysipelotrichaceae bacterium]
MKKLLKNRVNEKGSVLQITLIAFLVFTFSLTVALTSIKQNVTLYHYTHIMMTQKNLEIMLVRYYLDEMENSILLSDSYDNDQYSISSLVDNMGDYYEITTHIESTDFDYSFKINITLDSLNVTEFEYMEEN